VSDDLHQEIRAAVGRVERAEEAVRRGRDEDEPAGGDDGAAEVL